MNYGMNNLWPTPVLLEKIQDTDILDLTVQEILTTTDLSTPPSDFQSYDILADGGPVFEKFRKNIVEPIFDRYLIEVYGFSLHDTQYSFRSWLTGTGHSYMIPVHNHSGASLSAIFYLLCEEDSKGGELFLIDPRSNANRGYLDRMKQPFASKTFLPTSGEVIVLPSYLYHQTLTFQGNLRLAMPVDLYVIE